MRKFYKTGKTKIVDKRGKLRTVYYKPSNKKLMLKQERLIKLARGKYIRYNVLDDIGYNSYDTDILKAYEKYFKEEIKPAIEEKKGLYRSQCTFIYPMNKKYKGGKGAKTSSGIKEEFRIWIYTDEPIITDNNLDRIKEIFFSEFVEEPPFNSITGKELNAEVEESDRGTNTLNVYYCKFFKDGTKTHPDMQRRYNLDGKEV